MTPGLRILIVDDDPEILRAVARGQSAAANEEVRGISSLTEMQAALDGPTLAVVLTEAHTPFGDAFEILAMVRARRPEWPVLLVTSRGGEETAALALRAGFDDYVPTPHYAQLGAVVADAVKRARGRRSPSLEAEDSQRRWDAEREELRTRQQMILQRMPIGCLVCDEQLHFTYWNPAAERLFGFTFAEVQGKHPFETIVAEASQALTKDVFRRLARGDLHANVIVENVTKGGRTLVCAWTNTPLLGPSGGFAGILSMCEDVTDRRQAEEQVRLSQRIEAVGRLAGGIAHDFNNLLNVVTGYSEMLLKELPPEGKPHRRADHILKAAQKAADLTRQLLAFSRQQILKPRVLDLNTLVADMRRMLRPLVREDIELVISSAPELGPVRADPSQIDQVLLNLAVNAIDAMPRGGTLAIETANKDFDEDYARLHSPAHPGAYVMLSVSDTGEGMDEATQARIFEPFYTTKVRGRGTGLGLSTVYGIVKQSDGFVWVYSEPGRGTTFKVYLPRVLDTPEQASRGQAGPPALGGSETILVVEDQETALEMFQEALSSRGYTVLKARDGAEGLSLAGQYSGTIDLVLTDVVLPKLGGRQMAEQVILKHPEARILFMSGYSSDTITRHGVLEPGIELIEKPFGPEALSRRVREILDRPKP